MHSAEHLGPPLDAPSGLHRLLVIYCIPRKYNVTLIITNLTSALNSLKFLVVNVLRYAHAYVKHVKIVIIKGR